MQKPWAAKNSIYFSSMRARLSASTSASESVFKFVKRKEVETMRTSHKI